MNKNKKSKNLHTLLVEFFDGLEEKIDDSWLRTAYKHVFGAGIDSLDEKEPSVELCMKPKAEGGTHSHLPTHGEGIAAEPRGLSLYVAFTSKSAQA